VDAYEVLVVRHTALAHRTAVLLGAGDDADDIIQTAFVKAYQALHGFKDSAAFRPWLLRIVANETHNLTRGRGRRDRAILRAAVLAETAPAVREPADLVVAAERRTTLLAAVRELPEKERLVVIYRFLLDLSEAETAAALGWPRGSVKSRLSRALRRLKADLEEATHV
jgi:RNA polymerase sigma-70 factor (ECF subfamily)